MFATGMMIPVSWSAVDVNASQNGWAPHTAESECLLQIADHSLIVWRATADELAAFT